MYIRCCCVLSVLPLMMLRLDDVELTLTLAGQDALAQKSKVVLLWVCLVPSVIVRVRVAQFHFVARAACG